jgi:hypothetical protein
MRKPKFRKKKPPKRVLALTSVANKNSELPSTTD